MMFNSNEILKAAGAELVKNISQSDDFDISTDTRTIKKGELYLPLKGVSFDGEDFLDKAIESGAAGCFITKDYFPENAMIVFKVKNTLETYLRLANFYRNKKNPIVVAVTGSSGKTTTKEMIYSVLSEHFKAHKTLSNHNNEIGFCQTVLSMPEDCEVLIVEMGMRGFGEIELLSKYAEPDYAVITNTGSAHIGRLGSLDNIAKAKCEIVKYLKNDGVFIAQNNERIKKFAEFDGEKIYYSINDVEVLERKPSYSRYIYNGKEYELNVEGDYNIENSLSAITLAYKLGMSYEKIRKGLASYKPIEKRWEVQDIRGYKVINDSYNANPDSMKAAVSAFVQLYKNPVVVLGDMGELGESEQELHKQVGEYLSTVAPKTCKFLTVGHLAEKIGIPLQEKGFYVKNFENNEEAAEFMLANIDAGNTIFLKASRSMKFEKIIEKFKGEVRV